MVIRSCVEAIVSSCVTVHPHETSALLHSFSCFFFILSAYFVILPLRDEGAISLGLGNLPGLFVGSLALTLLAAPVSTFIFSLPSLSKGKDLNLEVDQASAARSGGWSNHGWFYVSVRIGLFLWVALLNLITISSTWARVIDVMDSESGSRLFGFIGAGATLGQLFGSLFASGMAWLGPFLLLFAALLMELAAQSSKGINQDKNHLSEELSLIRKADPDQQNDADEQSSPVLRGSTPKLSTSAAKPQLWALLDGLQLILSSTYLLYVSLFLWLGAIVSSFFYFQKVTIIAMTVSSPLDRRRLFAKINSFIAIFILAGQLTLTGRILTSAGVRTAICAAPIIAFSNLVAIAVWPTWVAVAVSETLRKVVTYVLTRPGRELLFTVLSQDEKYKAKVCIDVIVQRLGDAAAAGIYKLLFNAFNGQTSTVSLYALPVCLLWIFTAFYLGGRQSELAKPQAAAA
ncbi:uncharacterized protein LOC131165524 isoform X2 [Malania oleifera]|uniref:uncharacterized protein LOC131165524 isoform X2 n=1 Tax=Malania oleifera TaxID=397392 RepID=UPI0025AEB766|nr:uncharacterized protein LOC131165524 isoform X2 [Malania oleifera]